MSARVVNEIGEDLRASFFVMNMGLCVGLFPSPKKKFHALRHFGDSQVWSTGLVPRTESSSSLASAGVGGRVGVGHYWVEAYIEDYAMEREWRGQRRINFIATF